MIYYRKLFVIKWSEKEGRRRRVFCDCFSKRKSSSVREISRSSALNRRRRIFMRQQLLPFKFDGEAARDFVREFCNAPTIAVRSLYVTS